MEEQTLENVTHQSNAKRMKRRLQPSGRWGHATRDAPCGFTPASVRRLVTKQEDSENEAPCHLFPFLSLLRNPSPLGNHARVSVEQEPDKVRKRSLDVRRRCAEESEMEEVRYSDAEVPLVSKEENAPALPPPRHSTETARSAETLPSPLTRMTSCSPPSGRPPIPTALLGRRSTTMAGRCRCRTQYRHHWMSGVLERRLRFLSAPPRALPAPIRVHQ